MTHPNSNQETDRKDDKDKKQSSEAQKKEINREVGISGDESGSSRKE